MWREFPAVPAKTVALSELNDSEKEGAKWLEMGRDASPFSRYGLQAWAQLRGRGCQAASHLSRGTGDPLVDGQAQPKRTGRMAILAIALTMFVIAAALGSYFGSQGPPVVSSVAGASYYSTLSSTPSSGYSLSIAADRPEYTINDSVTVRGSLSPPPQAASNVTIAVDGPLGVVAMATTPVSVADGTFECTFVAGGAGGWVTGVYGVTARWSLSAENATATTAFGYSVPAAG